MKPIKQHKKNQQGNCPADYKLEEKNKMNGYLFERLCVEVILSTKVLILQ